MLEQDVSDHLVFIRISTLHMYQGEFDVTVILLNNKAYNCHILWAEKLLRYKIRYIYVLYNFLSLAFLGPEKNSSQLQFTANVIAMKLLKNEKSITAIKREDSKMHSVEGTI